jgi:hypothetical protein
VLAVAVFLVGRLAADDSTLPPHERIDRLIESSGTEGFAPAATDGEFLRRATLDLTGTIPTSTDARAFIDDPSSHKRRRLIDGLLESPEFSRRMSTYFDIFLMERRPDQHVPTAVWRDYLYQAVRLNKPFDQIAREILSSNGADAETRGPAKFYLDRGGDPNLLTRDVGRLFLGLDLQCAQCHDHPLIDDYKQSHYYGLFAFFSRGQMAPNARGQMILGEKADGDVTFSSVFVKQVSHSTGPRVLDGVEEADPAARPGEEYWAFPGGASWAIPRYSRRALLPGRITDPSLNAFSRNIANRLWALVMGRGVVEPLDMHHSENPPASPELLDLLAREFVAAKYDIKSFMRDLVLTRCYERSSEPSDAGEAGSPGRAELPVAPVRPLSPEQMGWSVMQATGVLANYRAAAEQALIRYDPKLQAIVDCDAPRRRLRGELIEQRVYEQLNPSVAVFERQFGGVAGQSQERTQSTVHQALMLTNGEPIQSWLNPTGENLTARLAKLSDVGALAEELYLSVLTRRPTAEERAEVAGYLASRGTERDAAIRELAWALLTSLEFRFNH